MTSNVDIIDNPATETSEPPAPVRTVNESITIIRPSPGWQLLNLRELWQFRGLIYHFVWRDVKVRYKHTLLGIGWAVLQPLMMMLVFTTYFGVMHTAKPDEVPYPLYCACGIMPWLFFSSATMAAGHSVVHSEHLITKIYFPRLVVPFASVGAFIVDFVVTLGLLIAVLAYYGHPPGIEILLAPLIGVFFIFAALGMGTLLAVLNVTYKDFRLIIPFMMQLWFFATPNIFLQVPDVVDYDMPPVEQSESEPSRPNILSVTTVHQQTVKAKQRYELMIVVNPMTSLIAAFRATIVGGSIPWGYVALSMSIFVLIFLIGTLYFRKVEDGFADII
jgi:lipopolysaccharide transport system permease protein